MTTALLDWLTERWALHPGMHVYHYAPYETTALKRLVGQHATREAELDQLLRHEVFVDLYAVVRQGVRISKGSYSIKKLEEFYWGHTRPSGGSGVADGLSSVVEYERWVAGRDDGAPDQTILDDIRRYNREDVRSTLGLHDWLEARRSDLLSSGHALSRPLLEPAQQRNLEFRYYPSGHMVYLNPDALHTMRVDVERFIASAVGEARAAPVQRRR